MSSRTVTQESSLNKKLRPVYTFSKGVFKAAGGTVLGITMIASSIVAGGLVGLAISFRNLPDVRVLRSYVPSETSYIYDIKGRLLTSLH